MKRLDRTPAARLKLKADRVARRLWPGLVYPPTSNTSRDLRPLRRAEALPTTAPGRSRAEVR
jgi:hypothetical protein